MIMNSARGDFYPDCSTETEGPVIAAEARIREFGSPASKKGDVVFEKMEKWKNYKKSKTQKLI